MARPPRFQRLVAATRRWRSRADTTPEVAANLPDRDLDQIGRLVEGAITDRGGEVAARQRAKVLADVYQQLDEDGQHRFFELLTHQYGYDDAAIAAAIAPIADNTSASSSDDAGANAGAADPTAGDSSEASNLHAAYRDLAAVLQPRYRILLSRFAGLDNGFAFLIKMREAVMSLHRSRGGLAGLDHELRNLLESWFDVSLLRLERLSWDTPASTLELLIKYEAVHEIASWDDLRRRLGTGRRCYAFMHPAMPGDPLIFVEVALTQGMADSVQPFLNESAPTPETDADTAIFYSISNCHRGLAGVSLGDFLIKSVVQALIADLPQLERFATLSPLPKFRSWLSAALANGDRLIDGVATTGLAELIDGPLPAADDPRLAAARPALLQAAARYIVLARRPNGRAADPVANFHLSNGARAERLNFMANMTDTGWERGLGMMINYRYRLQSIERNHDLYINAGEVAAAPAIADLLPKP